MQERWIADRTMLQHDRIAHERGRKSMSCSISDCVMLLEQTSGREWLLKLMNM